MKTKTLKKKSLYSFVVDTVRYSIAKCVGFSVQDHINTNTDCPSIKQSVIDLTKTPVHNCVENSMARFVVQYVWADFRYRKEMYHSDPIWKFILNNAKHRKNK
jgi:hypothetical protein